MDIREITSRLRKIRRTGDGFMACCPAHPDNTPSLSLKQTPEGRILLHCFAGCSEDAVLSALGISSEDLRPYQNFPLPKEFPSGSGPVKSNGEFVCAYVYQNTSGEPVFEVCRYKPKTFRIRRFKDGQVLWGLGDAEPVLYGLPELREGISQGKVVYVCEGEKDCDRLRTLGLVATTAPMGAGKWRENYTEALRGASLVTLLPDNDEPGRSHAVLISTKLRDAGIRCITKALWIADPTLPEHGDVSDFLDANPLAHLLDAPALTGLMEKSNPSEDNAAQVTLDTYLRDGFFQDNERFSLHPPLKTGFTSLDAILENRLLPGLYVLGAVSSLGKSAFCGQLCDNFAAQGRHVLFFTLEMPILEMAARSLARTLFTLDVKKYSHITTAHILNGSITPELMNYAVEIFLPTAKQITYIEGNFDLGVQQIRKHCEQACARGILPVVFVDYLQVLTPPGERLSDKQATDQNVVELKRISRDLGLPMVVISSLNRQNYNDELNFSAFKESGAIEYSADFVMGLQARGVAETAASHSSDERKLSRQIARTVREAKNQVPRPLEAVVLKNRRGTAQSVFDLQYWPAANYFEECGK